jgi:phage-related minor tail protein
LQLQSREQQLEVQHINVREHQSAVSRQAMADRLADVERERASLELRLGEETQQARFAFALSICIDYCNGEL